MNNNERSKIVLLTHERKGQYINDGYLIFDPEVPTTVLDSIIADITYIYQRPYRVSYNGG